MGSIGQGVIGGDSCFGGHVPDYPQLLNTTNIQALAPAFELASTHRDRFEHLWFDAKVLYIDEELGQWTQHVSPAYSVPRTETYNLGGSVVLATQLALKPGRTYVLKARVTSDPIADAMQRWWTEWFMFPFVPVLTEYPAHVINFVMWEDRFRRIMIPDGEQCTSTRPYAEWACSHPYDHFRWGISSVYNDTYMPFVTRVNAIDLSACPLHDGIWYLRIVPVWGSYIGVSFTYTFRVVGTVIRID